VKVYNISRSDINDVVTEVLKSKALLVGSPTINRRILSALGGFLEEIRGLGFKNKKGAAFGCYGWSGEGVKIISEELKACGFDLFNEGIRVMWDPDSEAFSNCISFGKQLASSLK
jgi:flavorubredoxin